MHRVKVSAVKTLETAKFDAEKAQWTNPPKATIKWAEEVTLADAAIYNNQEVIILTVGEYETLKEGFKGSISPDMRERLSHALTLVLDLLRADAEVVEEEPALEFDR